MSKHTNVNELLYCITIRLERAFGDIYDNNSALLFYLSLLHLQSISLKRPKHWKHESYWQMFLPIFSRFVIRAWNKPCWHAHNLYSITHFAVLAFKGNASSLNVLQNNWCAEKLLYNMTGLLKEDTETNFS